MESAAHIDNLNDIAALLIQLDPGEPSELRQVKEAVDEFSRNLPSSVLRDLFLQVSHKLDEMMQNQISDPSNLMREIGELVEKAMDLSSGNDSPNQVSIPEDSDPELISAFITETQDLISEAESALLSLEANPDDMDAVNTVFRAFHTVKGTASFLGLEHLSNLAHHAESLLSRVRDGEIKLIGTYADIALNSVDMIKEFIQIIQNGLGGEQMRLPEGYEKLIEILSDPHQETNPHEDVPRVGDILVAQGKAERDEIETVALDKGDRPIGEAIVRSGAATLSDVAHAIRTQKKMIASESTPESSVRVRTDRLDRLIDMVGELVIAYSMVAQDEAVRSDEGELQKKVTHTGKIIRELQDLTLSLRMVPLKPVFQRMTRLVRDLSKRSGKLINFITEGEETEIDRNMVDIIKDPLIHMIRNAVDHGIELPDLRERRGKPREGVIRLAAYHSGGNVVVEVQDDGAGLNKEKIVQKAISKGLIRSAKGMTDREIYNLIFAPGFSTAEEVTDVSGRGVGMDVVKRNVELLGGRIDVSSQQGEGTTFTLKLPLTMAITDGMLVRVGEERYIIPTASIYMSFRPRREDLSTYAERGEMVVFRGELMPVFRLYKLFGIEGAVEDPTEGLLVIMEDGDQRYALLVDELLSQHQVVVKSLGEGLGNIEGISGGAILGDGQVGLILDPAGISSIARRKEEIR